jgi:hypothetical protein
MRPTEQEGRRKEGRKEGDEARERRILGEWDTKEGGK